MNLIVVSKHSCLCTKLTGITPPDIVIIPFTNARR